MRNIARAASASTMFQDFGQNRNLYTARASYVDMQQDAIVTKGIIFDINRERTLANVCCKRKSFCKINRTSSIAFQMLSLFCMCLSVCALAGAIPLYISVISSAIWLGYPISLLLNANAKILRRLLRFSGSPWFHLYLSVLQTWALCDLFNYSLRHVFCTMPMMMLSVFSLTISDAVYITEDERKLARFDVFCCMLWQIVLCTGVRYSLFSSMMARGLLRTMSSDTSDVYFQNSSLFCGKSVSILMFLCNQLIFRFRHPEMAFSLRTHYSLLNNADWAKKESRIRIFRKHRLQQRVEMTRKSLSMSATKEISL